MRFAVTGSNGFLGRHLCQRLIESGHETAGVDNLSTGLARHDVSGALYHRRDISDISWLTKFLDAYRPQVVVHLAAIAREGHGWREPFLCAQTNVAGTVAVLEALRRAGLTQQTRMVLASSSAIYGDALTLPTSEFSSWSAAPQSLYGLSKQVSENWCYLHSQRYGQDAVCLRFGNIYGPHVYQITPDSRVIDTWAYSLAVDSAHPAYLEGDGTQIRDFIYADDAVEAIIAAATRERFCPALAYNIGSGSACTLIDLQHLLEEIAEAPLNCCEARPRAGAPHGVWLNISLAEKDLHWVPRVSLRDGLERTLRWFREAQWTGTDRAVVPRDSEELA